MMLAVIASVLTLAIVAFVIGYVCGKDSGRQQERHRAHDLCIEYAELALRHPAWRLMTPAAALQRVAKLFVGSESKA
jgi:hypothetical protein